MHTQSTSSTSSWPSSNQSSIRRWNKILLRRTLRKVEMSCQRQTEVGTTARMTSSGHSCDDYRSGSSGKFKPSFTQSVYLSDQGQLANRLSATKSTVISLVCSFFVAFDIPVYWPILVMYFFALFAITMRRQIRYVELIQIGILISHTHPLVDLVI